MENTGGTRGKTQPRGDVDLPEDDFNTGDLLVIENATTNDMEIFLCVGNPADWEEDSNPETTLRTGKDNPLFLPKLSLVAGKAKPKTSVAIAKISAEIAFPDETPSRTGNGSEKGTTGKITFAMDFLQKNQSSENDKFGQNVADIEIGGDAAKAFQIFRCDQFVPSGEKNHLISICDNREEF